ERAERLFGEQHDHFTVEKIRWLPITAADFVRAQEGDVAHGLGNTPDRTVAAVADYIQDLQVDGRDGSYHALGSERIECVDGALRPIPGIATKVRIVEQLEQGNPVVYGKAISRATAKPFRSGTSVGEIVDQTERIASAGQADAAHNFRNLMCCDAPK